LKKQGVLRFCSFTLALSVIFAGSTVYYANRNMQYERYVDNQYKRALSQLLSSVNQLETSLEKAQYLSPGALRQTMAADIWKESQLAAYALSVLPLGEQRPEQLEAYLSKVGDYAYYLMRSTAYGKDDGAEWDSLCALCGNAQGILNELDSMKQKLDTGILNWSVLEKAAADQSSVGEQFLLVNDEFPEYPSLIYDGPYSDHISQRSARALEGLSRLSLQQVRERAASLMNVPAAQLNMDYESDGQIPCYGFSWGTVSAAFSKQGAFLLSLTDTRPIGEAVLNAQLAVKHAQAFLKMLGLPEMRASYYTEYETILTINFHSFENGVLSYPDLIKVGIALDDGSVVRLDAAGFAMNYHARSAVQPTVDADTARKALPKSLRVQQERLCYIPTTGHHEVLCWEFLCSTADEKQLLQYINCETGQTENILLLMERENGTLTR